MDLSTGIAIAGMALGWAFTLGKFVAQHKRTESELIKLEGSMDARLETVDVKLNRNLEKIHNKLDGTPCRSIGGVCPMSQGFGQRFERMESQLEKIMLSQRDLEISMHKGRSSQPAGDQR